VKRLRTLPLIICFAAISLIGTCRAQRFSNNDRRSVVLNAFYALRPTHDGGCDIVDVAGRCLSSWNYLDSDFPTYSNLKGTYGCNASDWAVTGDPCPNLMGMTVPSFYSNLLSYGLSSGGGSYGAIGRGGQCRIFANIVVERGLQASIIFPTYATMWNNGNGVQTDLTKAVPGDILTTNPGFVPQFFHTAIVVEIKKDGSGNVIGLDIIDSNFIPDIGSTQNREVIARHVITLPQPANKYGLWKGVPYYGQPYVP
jgi:hypothetical protein